jgi:hypothetical protein
LSTVDSVHDHASVPSFHGGSIAWVADDWRGGYLHTPDGRPSDFGNTRHHHGRPRGGHPTSALHDRKLDGRLKAAHGEKKEGASRFRHVSEQASAMSRLNTKASHDE